MREWHLWNPRLRTDTLPAGRQCQPGPTHLLSDRRCDARAVRDAHRSARVSFPEREQAPPPNDYLFLDGRSFLNGRSPEGRGSPMPIDSVSRCPARYRDSLRVATRSCCSSCSRSRDHHLLASTIDSRSQLRPLLTCSRVYVCVDTSFGAPHPTFCRLHLQATHPVSGGVG